MSYDAARVAAYDDQLGHAEWDRWERSLGDRISLLLHTEPVERVVPPGGRVLEVGAGPGRFTEVLHRLGCRIVVGDLSTTQLACNRELGQARGFAASVEDCGNSTSATSAASTMNPTMRSSCSADR